MTNEHETFAPDEQTSVTDIDDFRRLKRFKVLLEKSSLGTPEAKIHRHATPPEVAKRIADMTVGNPANDDVEHEVE